MAAIDSSAGRRTRFALMRHTVALSLHRVGTGSYRVYDITVVTLVVLDKEGLKDMLAGGS